MIFFKTYRSFLLKGLSRLEADLISYIAVFSKGCYQTNQQIADELVSSQNRIRVVISNLVKSGWLNSQIIKESGNLRILTVSKKASDVMSGTDPMIENDQTYDHQRSDSMIINDHTPDHLRSDPMIENDQTYDHLRSSYFINRILIENGIEKEIDLCVSQKEATPTHTQNKDSVPSIETICKQFAENQENICHDVAVTEATKFRNYYLSHPEKQAKNIKKWLGLISNWQIRDCDGLFAKNTIETKESAEKRLGDVNYQFMGKWFSQK